MVRVNQTAKQSLIILFVSSVIIPSLYVLLGLLGASLLIFLDPGFSIVILLMFAIPFILTFIFKRIFPNISLLRIILLVFFPIYLLLLFAVVENHFRQRQYLQKEQQLFMESQKVVR